MANLSDILDFESLFSKSNRNGETDVPIVRYVTVHRDDHEPVSIVAPNLKEGPWIAGGACLRWFQNQPVGESDIDVFCRDAIQAEQVIERIKSYNRYSIRFESDNAVTFDYWQKGSENKWTIQVVKRRYFKSIQEVIDSFDITVCEIGTAGFEWELGNITAKDIREKNLRFKLPLQPDAPKRLTKYWIYGYRPVDGTIELIQNNPNTRWTYRPEEDYENAF